MSIDEPRQQVLSRTVNFLYDFGDANPGRDLRDVTVLDQNVLRLCRTRARAIDNDDVSYDACRSHSVCTPEDRSSLPFTLCRFPSAVSPD
ncbi:hypothetical protein [Microbacterium sp.]|uniref:hypothetical protein n=1 Tax=Microbacterium sp. TaxID=51671 RepID=UPI003F9B0916